MKTHWFPLSRPAFFRAGGAFLGGGYVARGGGGWLNSHDSGGTWRQHSTGNVFLRPFPPVGLVTPKGSEKDQGIRSPKWAKHSGSGIIINCPVSKCLGSPPFISHEWSPFGRGHTTLSLGSPQHARKIV